MAPFSINVGARQLTKLYAVILAGFAVFASLYIRLVSWKNFISPDGGFYFYSIDSYDHLRRITLGVKSFPHIPSFDYYAAFPKGMGQIWSPLFDYFFSALCFIGGGSQKFIETICFFANPFFAVLAMLLVFLAAQKSFSSYHAGVAALLLLAFSPGHIAYTIPMNFDHHAVEPIIFLAIFSIPFLEKDQRLSTFSIIYAVVILVGAIFLWRGSTIFWGMAFLSALLRAFFAEKRQLARDYSLVFTFAAILVACYCLFDPWGNAGTPSFRIISWFHAAVLAGFSYALFMVFNRDSKKKILVLSIGMAISVVIICVFFPVLEFFKQFVGGISLMSGKGDPWLESNSELKGVFSSSMPFVFSASYLTPFWFCTPFIVMVAFVSWFKNGKQENLLLNFIVWSPTIFFGFIIRYSHVAAIITALAWAWFVAYIWQRKRRILTYCLVLCTLIMVSVSWQHHKITASANLPASLKYGLYGKDGVLEWIRGNTPVTSYWDNPVALPEYGVLARWSMGARIYQLAQRPVLATAFGWENHGFYEQAGFWVTEKKHIAQQILKENKIRYIVLKALHDLKSDFAISQHGVNRNKLPKEILSAKLVKEKTMYSRLMNGDGSAGMINGSFTPALNGYRLVHESKLLSGNKRGADDISEYKVFEVVPGAIIEGRTKSFGTVSMMMEFETTRGRKVVYFDRVPSDSTGKFIFSTPYNTEARQGDTVPTSRLNIFIGGEKKIEVTVTESKVMMGEKIYLGEI